MRGIANSLLMATQFLTRLPVSPIEEFSTDRLAASTVFFPLVGLLVGAGGLVLHLILSPSANGSVVVMGFLMYLVAVTGGLHEDALADDPAATRWHTVAARLQRDGLYTKAVGIRTGSSSPIRCQQDYKD
jgi:hypothetical protein